MVFTWERYLKVSDWTSSYRSVDRLLSHLERIGGSWASRSLYCTHLHAFCLNTGKTPDELVCMDNGGLVSLVQSFCDQKYSRNQNPRSANVTMETLKTFFRFNGFKGDKELDVEGYSLRGFFRKRPEYIPTLLEAFRMANVAGSLKNRAIILVLLSTGLRNSTLRAILYGEIKEELDRGLDSIHIKVHRGMKQIVPNACKDGIEYSIFTCPEATEAIRLYVKDRVRKFGEIDGQEPLFIPVPGRLRRRERGCKPLTSREIELIVKEAAKRAGIDEWKAVTPTCLRKTFESVLRSLFVDGSRMDLKTQEIFMGHKLPGSMYFYYNRSNVADLREAYSKLVFTSLDKGRFEASESLRIIAETLGIDFDRLVEGRERDLGSELNSGERLQFLQETVREVVRQFREIAAGRKQPVNTQDLVEKAPLILEAEETLDSNPPAKTLHTAPSKGKHPTNAKTECDLSEFF